MKQALFSISVSAALLACMLVYSPFAGASDRVVRIAVASNFSSTLGRMRPAFESSGDFVISISAGSSGKLFAQIRNGAPFDVLLSADSERPLLLEQAALSVPGSRFTYAEGRLVLWSRDGRLGEGDCLRALLQESAEHVAIANPRTAPYGEAARQALIDLGVWEQVEPKLVFGENISQTLQFVASGAARLGFVAASQLNSGALPTTTCRWDVPASAHEPIRQQAVLLSRAADNAGAKAFLAFLKSEAGRAIIARDGYRLADID